MEVFRLLKNENNAQYHFWLPQGLLDRLRKAAAATDRTVSAGIRVAIAEWCRRIERRVSDERLDEDD